MKIIKIKNKELEYFKNLKEEERIDNYYVWLIEHDEDNYYDTAENYLDWQENFVCLHYDKETNLYHLYYYIIESNSKHTYYDIYLKEEN